MGRGCGRRGRWPAPFLVILLTAIVAPAAEPASVERFRTAAALQERALYDLAVAEYAVVVIDAADDPLAARARLQCGVCLFHLARFQAARDELRQLAEHTVGLSDREAEQLLAFLGLAEYNLSHAAADAERGDRLDAAIRALDEQLSRYSDGDLAPLSAYYRGEALYARGRLDEAVAAYRELLTRYPQHPQRADVLFALGVAEQDRGECAAAVQAFDFFSQEFPQHPSATDANNRHGDCLLAVVETGFAAGRFDATHGAIARLLAEFPESARVLRALLIRAAMEAQESQVVAAEATLDRCLARCTEGDVAIEARLLRATLRHGRGDFSGGLADAERVLVAAPTRTAALHVRGLCQLGLRRPIEAAETLATIVKVAPDYPALDRVLYDLAWAYHESNEPEKATAAYATLIESHPASPLAAESHYRVGESHFAAGEFAAAAAGFHAAIESASVAALLEKGTHKLAWCQFELGDFAAAQASFDRQIAEHAQGSLAADARIMTAECRFQRQHFAAALPMFVTGINASGACDSLRAMAFSHAVQSASQLGEWSRSLELAERARKECPASEWAAEVRCEQCVALFELGRLDDAQRELSAVLADEQGVVQLRAAFTLARIHLARKETEEAVRLFFKVAYGHGGKSAPASYHHWQAEATYAAARALDETQRPDAARKLYQELVDEYPASPRATTARQTLDQFLRR